MSNEETGTVFFKRTNSFCKMSLFFFFTNIADRDIVIILNYKSYKWCILKALLIQNIKN